MMGWIFAIFSLRRAPQLHRLSPPPVVGTGLFREEPTGFRRPPTAGGRTGGRTLEARPPIPAALPAGRRSTRAGRARPAKVGKDAGKPTQQRHCRLPFSLQPPMGFSPKLQEEEEEFRMATKAVKKASARPVSKLDMTKAVKVNSSAKPRSKGDVFSTIAQHVGIHRRDVAAVFH